MNHLTAIYEAVDRPERLGICLDTAHFFAAGYDIRTEKGWNDALAELDSTVGLKEVLAFHLNDSKTDLGSRVDRHAGIGQGKIGREAFRHIINDARFINHPGCLETPKGKDLKEDVENLAILRSLLNAAKSGKATFTTKVKARATHTKKRVKVRARKVRASVAKKLAASSP